MKTFPVPVPVSAGLILSYQCNAACRHCMYACSPHWGNHWIAPDDLEQVLGQLARTIEPAPYGPDSVSLSHGLHFTGGEPFLNFPLLCRAVEMASVLGIPSTFVETNGFWATAEEQTREKLLFLRNLGLKGLMISVNPFYLEYVPFRRTRRCVEASLEIFGSNTMVYQLEYYQRFLTLKITGKLPLDSYLAMEKAENFFHHVEFFVMGRAPYRLGAKLTGLLSSFPASYFYHQPCDPPFLRNWHNHVDNYGNYMPGFCGGISLGDARVLDKLLEEEIDGERRPVLTLILENDFQGLYHFAGNRGYQESETGYFSKCHLCVDIRRHLAFQDDYTELQPLEFYRQLQMKR